MVFSSIKVVTEHDAWQLPWKIEKNSFDTLLKVLEENQTDSSVLKKWYRVDENSRTAEYVCVEARNSSQNGDVNGWKDAKLQIEALIQHGVQNTGIESARKDLHRILMFG